MIKQVKHICVKNIKEKVTIFKNKKSFLCGVFICEAFLKTEYDIY